MRSRSSTQGQPAQGAGARRTNGESSISRDLQQTRLSKAMRVARKSTSNPALARIAVDTIEMIEQRIEYWLGVGDDEHVRRLEHIRSQLVSTYLN